MSGPLRFSGRPRQADPGEVGHQSRSLAASFAPPRRPETRQEARCPARGFGLSQLLRVRLGLRLPYLRRLGLVLGSGQLDLSVSEL